MAQQDSIQFIKDKSAALEKYLTLEHRKIIDNFKFIKEHTREAMQRLQYLEIERIEYQKRQAIEQGAKEGLYALDMYTPLRLYDCLLPELDAYRP